MPKLESVKPSPRKDKKYVATFDDGTKTHFGAKGMSDYTKHKDEDRKQSYIARHRPNEDWTDPTKAGTLSRFLLWNKPTLSASVADFQKRFDSFV